MKNLPSYLKPRLKYNKTKGWAPTKIKAGFIQAGPTRLRHGSSKSENDWLNLLGVSIRSKVIHGFGRNVYIVDGYSPTPFPGRRKPCVYEFCGSFYHGDKKVYNPNAYNPLTRCTYGELYNKTVARFNFLYNIGYDIAYVWESDYKKNKCHVQFYEPGKPL